MKNMSKTLLLSVSLSLVSTQSTANEVKLENPEGKGMAIMSEFERRDNGWGSSKVNMRMVLKNARGDESKRDLEVKFLEVEGDGDKTLTNFKTPRDISNTAFLSYSHAEDPDDQWIYIPSIKRIKRINSANKSGPFMGSELAYEDITSFELAKYSFRYIGETNFEGTECYKVELTPLYEYSGYSTLVYWVDKSKYIPMKMEYYGKSNSLLKVQTFRDYVLYKDKYWRPSEAIIKNVVNNRSTHLYWDKFDFDVSLTSNDFTKVGLRRLR